MIEVHWGQLLFMIPLSFYGAWHLGQWLAARSHARLVSDVLGQGRGYQPKPGKSRAVKRPPKVP